MTIKRKTELLTQVYVGLSTLQINAKTPHTPAVVGIKKRSLILSIHTTRLSGMA